MNVTQSQNLGRDHNHGHNISHITMSTRSKPSPRKGANYGKKKKYEEQCYRCGMEAHWPRTCRTIDLLLRTLSSIFEKER